MTRISGVYEHLDEWLSKHRIVLFILQVIIAAIFVYCLSMLILHVTDAWGFEHMAIASNQPSVTENDGQTQFLEHG